MARVSRVKNYEVIDDFMEPGYDNRYDDFMSRHKGPLSVQTWKLYGRLHEFLKELETSYFFYFFYCFEGFEVEETVDLLLKKSSTLLGCVIVDTFSLRAVADPNRTIRRIDRNLRIRRGNPSSQS